LQVFCPFASSSLMSDAKPRARSGVFFSSISPARPPTYLPAWIFYHWSCEDESELRGRKLRGLCVCDVQDNVFVTVVASVQYRAHIETAEDAFYKLTNPREQIKSYVFDGKYSSPFCK
jgi:hypothetical protein